MQVYRLLRCDILFLAVTGMVILFHMQPASNTPIKQWQAYLESLEVTSLMKLVSNHGYSYMEITLSIYSVLRQRVAVLCPRIHYSFLEDSPRKTHSLCGRIAILTNSEKNTEDLRTVYTIVVPRKFNINFSLVDFSEDFTHPSYTGCGFNDILISSETQRWATFCGKPFPQTIIVGDSMAHVQSYHQPYEGESPTLHLTVYFEVIPMQTGIHSQEHHIQFSKLKDFYSLGVTNYMVGSISGSRYSLQIYKLGDTCHYEETIAWERLKLLHKCLPIRMAIMLHDFSILGYMTVDDDLTRLIDFGGHPEIIQSFSSTDRLTIHEQIKPIPHWITSHPEKISGTDRYAINMYNLLVTRPRNLLRPLYGKLVQTSETGPTLVEIRVWTIHGQQFVNGLLQFGQLLAEIQGKNCPTEDTVVVYDGPHSGMLTPYGLTSPFAVLYNGRCRDIINAVKSSLGDLTISWIHHNADEGDVGFMYKQQPVRCSQIPCTYTNVSVTGLEKTLIFKQTDRPSFQVFRFVARNEGNVRLRFQIQTADIPHSIEGCLYSAMWLFEVSLRGVFCTQSEMMLLNSSTVQTKGIQFNRLAELVVKSYPQNVHIKFSIYFLTTNCLGLLNPCSNAYYARAASHNMCFPQINQLGMISISESQARDCCFVLTYLENSLSVPWHCVFGFLHLSPGSLLRVDHTEFTAPFKISCCNEVIFSATLHIRSIEHFHRKGCLYRLPRLKNKMFMTTDFMVSVQRHLNFGGCSSIIGVAVEQPSICMDLKVPKMVARKLAGYNNNLALFYSCINSGVDVSPYMSVQITAYTKEFDAHMEYYFKLNGSIHIRKVTLVNIITFPMIQYGGDWEWELRLEGLHDEFYQLIDSIKRRHGVRLFAASVRLIASFVLHFRMKKPHPIKSDAFYVTASDPCHGSSFSLLSRCYRQVGTAEKMSWLEASQTCADHGMNMLSLNSEQEWLALAAYLFEKKLDVGTVFLGLQREKVSLEYSNIR